MGCKEMVCFHDGQGQLGDLGDMLTHVAFKNGHPSTADDLEFTFFSVITAIHASKLHPAARLGCPPFLQQPLHLTHGNSPLVLFVILLNSSPALN